MWRNGAPICGAAVSSRWAQRASLRRASSTSTDAAAASGWFLIGVSTIIFAVVDAIVGFVLTPVAAASGASATLLGTKHLFDALFLLGTATFGAGAVLATANSAFGQTGPIWRLTAGLAVIAGAVALVSGAGSLAGVHLERYVGFGILGGSAIFTLIGFQIAFFPKRFA